MDSNMPGVSEIQSVCTQYAADMIVNQLKVARSVNYKVEVSESKENAETVVSYQDRSYSVSVDKGTCSCTFQRTMLMPCRHVFKCRLDCGLVTLDQSLVADRWLKECQICIGESNDESLQDGNNVDDIGGLSNEAQISSVSSSSFLGSTLARNQKYRKILSLTNKLAVVASQCGMPEFRE